MLRFPPDQDHNQPGDFRERSRVSSGRLDHSPPTPKPSSSPTRTLSPTPSPSSTWTPTPPTATPPVLQLLLSEAMVDPIEQSQRENGSKYSTLQAEPWICPVPNWANPSCLIVGKGCWFFHLDRFWYPGDLHWLPIKLILFRTDGSFFRILKFNLPSRRSLIWNPMPGGVGQIFISATRGMRYCCWMGGMPPLDRLPTAAPSSSPSQTVHPTGSSTSSQTVSPTVSATPVPQLVLNEILADPAAGERDANQNGVVNSSEDEFLEFINSGSAILDLSGWTISNQVTVRFTFPEGINLEPG